MILEIVVNIVFWAILIGLVIVAKKIRERRFKRKCREEGITEEEIKVKLVEYKREIKEKATGGFWKGFLWEILCALTIFGIIGLIILLKFMSF